MCKYVVVDLEMCKVPKANRIQYKHANETIQIGAVLLDDDYSELDRFVTLIKPRYGAVDSFITNLTGITAFDLSGAPSMETAVNAFLDWIPDGDVTMVSWSMTDQHQLKQEMEAFGIENEKLAGLLENWIDCQEMYDERLGYDHPCSLREALIATDVNADDREHDGLADAVNTAGLFRKINTEKELKLNKYYETAISGKSSRLTYSLADMIASLNINFQTV